MNFKLFKLIHTECPYKRYYYQKLPKDNLIYRFLFEIQSYIKIFINATYLPFNKKYNTQQFPGKRKSKLRMLCESLLWAFKYKEVCNYYFLYGLDIKGKSVNDFMAYTEFRVIRNIINIRQRENLNTKYTFNYLALVRDKFVFYQYCKSLGIPYPKTIALIRGNEISWYNGDEMIWNNINSIAERDFVGFCKEVTGEGGKGAFTIEVKDGKIIVSDKVETIEQLKKRIGLSTFIIQEYIKNHNDIRKIYPKSLNTVRIHTILKMDGTVDFFSAVHRFGANGSIVDNGCHGGLMVAVNKDGVLNDIGCHEPHIKKHLIVNGYHPDTDVKFAGLMVPHWNEIIETAKKLHRFMYGIPSIGWDVAVTEDGFCFTEAGEDWEIAFDQAANGGQRNHFYETHGYALSIQLRKI